MNSHIRNIYLGIGSNIAPQANIKQALDLLEIEFGPLQESPIYKNPAIGFSGPSFLNMVIAFESELSIFEIQKKIQQIETTIGIDPDNKQKFTSRIIDIDLLLAGEVIFNSDTLNIPRPGITQYPFILKPLLDVTPDLIDPLSGIPYSEIWTKIGNTVDAHEMEKVDI